ncbi:MAG: DUF4351 domain-containing protein [Leptolyngbyaceae cyanobacterium CSU_1_3]|nr:DUF4351 domain-containing protein [Leptolyngbyaceae cyanobacterium CSU_1_3]
MVYAITLPGLAIALITRQLTRRLRQELSEEMRPLRYLQSSARLSTLPLPVLEDLSEALLDFSEVSDLEAWFDLL